MLYAKLEEDFGLARNAMKIYDRGTENVSPEQLLDFYTVYISKAAEFFGLVSTREIYQKALETLPDIHAKVLAVKFAEMETNFGEVDRSRAIFAYASQFADPRIDHQYWKSWHEFEVKYGNEDTYKEMLRVKRSIQAKYNSEINYITSQILANRQIEMTNNVPEENGGNQQQEEGTRVVGFVRAQTTEPIINKPAEANPDEIEVDDVSSSDEDEIETKKIRTDEPDTNFSDIEKMKVPEAVFGSLADKVHEEQTEAKVGAKDRFKRKRG